MDYLVTQASGNEVSPLTQRHRSDYEARRRSGALENLATWGSLTFEASIPDDRSVRLQEAASGANESLPANPVTSAYTHNNVRPHICNILDGVAPSRHVSIGSKLLPEATNSSKRSL